MAAMIKVDRVSKWFSPAKKVVDEVSFEVEQGQTLILLGTSGGGKTTTLRMINRLIEPSSGAIYINGHNINDQSPENLRRGIGYVLQSSGLFPHYTVAENIAIVPTLLGWKPQKIAERTNALLEKLKLDPGEYKNVYPGQLSGGQQQRVGLARALAADQPVLLMDEPFGALDPITRVQVRRDFLSLDEWNTRTVIMVTHDVQEAFEMGNSICLMHEGKVQQWGKPSTLLFQPANDWVRSFFEENRFQLELVALSIEDVWPLSKVGNLPGSANIIPSSSSLWRALELASSSPDGNVSITYDHSVRILNRTDILTAYQNFKTVANG
jgi:osmoprotectant transport system ATP-binding protein